PQLDWDAWPAAFRGDGQSCSSYCRRRHAVLAFGRQTKTAGPTPCRFRISRTFCSLLLVNGLLEFGPRGEFRDLAGSDFDSGAGLRIAPVSCLSLRHREGAETYQSHPIPFAQRPSNAAYSGVNRSCSRRFADFASASDLVN